MSQSETFTVTFDGNQVGKYFDRAKAEIKARQVLRANPGQQVLIVHDAVYQGLQIVEG